jgi:hypothetical protein
MGDPWLPGQLKTGIRRKIRATTTQRGDGRVVWVHLRVGVPGTTNLDAHELRSFTNRASCHIIIAYLADVAAVDVHSHQGTE